MGKEIDWVSEDKSTGRLIYRRSYPASVRAALGWEKKVPLGARWRMTKASSAIYYRACDDFEREVAQAKAQLRLQAKKAAAAFDRLTSDQLDYLGAMLIHDRRTGMDQRVQEGHARSLGEIWGHVLPSIRDARVAGDAATLEEIFGPTADSLLASEGLRLDPADKSGRAALMWTLSARVVEEGDNFAKAAEGFSPPIPPKPERPSNPKGRSRTVSALIGAYKTDRWGGWSLSTRSAVSAPFRVLEDLVGDKPVADIDRDAAREIFDALKALPAGMGRNKALADLSVPEAIKRGRELGLPTIGPKTINGSYMSAIAAAFEWAFVEQWIAANPFKKMAAHDPVADRDKRDAFGPDQLQTLFRASPWDKPQDHAASKPGRYWLPLIALFTGMRRGEIAGLRVMDAVKLDGVPVLRVREYEGRTIKEAESVRDVPVPLALQRLGLMAFIKHRADRAGPSDLLFPDGKANVNGRWGAKLGEWFSDHLKSSGIIGTKLGMHSFRHNFEDRLKAAGVSGSAEALAVSGRSIAGSQSIYGSINAAGHGFPVANLANVLERVTYPELDLSHLDVPGEDALLCRAVTNPATGAPA